MTEKRATAGKAAAASTTGTATKPRKLTYDPYVRHSVTVNADPDRAFRVFVEDFPQWWPSMFRCTKVGAPLGVDPKKNGRWYEIDEEGNEHTFGRIRVLDRPTRLVIGWHLNGFGRVDPDHASEFEVQFVPDSRGRTKVMLEHTNFEEMGTKHAKRVRNGMDKGWPTLLNAFKEKIAEGGGGK
jgi:uncharacterized protein YndB with AHSA1/START domain